MRKVSNISMFIIIISPNKSCFALRLCSVTVSAVPRPAVLLQHGLLLTSTIFLLNSAQDSLGFLLADAGLDVWLANSRGNIYSTNHTMLDTQSNDFWDFSWDEMARYDLPAIIDFITKKTGQNQINYVGYSQGTTIGFAALSQSPQVAAKVKLFIALAPVGRVANITSVVRLLLPLTSKVKMIMKLFPHGNVNLDPDVSRNLAGYLCHERKDLLCERLFSLLVGSNPRSFDMSRLDVYMAHMPAGTSVRNLLHWAQAAMGGRFQHFDWGSPHANLEKYGQPNPPQYDLSRLKTPVAIFRGGQDALADTEDVRWLLPQLNVIQDVAVDYYNHMDFVAAPDAPQKIYWQLAAMLLT
ncbi:hypothetical protein RRG08_027905 [Elysia crispata]|uniref:AB hydrolase-1 domain-containing protein n=1 Tax=Elysia crispata TaxID=231223 RepID=A0AAE1DTQ8_9GAST|nr:hypothetical protein RRG08_027905 [Elysia crispata]